MSEIPEDVMQSARALHIALFDHCRDIPSVRINLEDIARAIMAERERCAKTCVSRSRRQREEAKQYEDAGDEDSQAGCLLAAVEAMDCALAIRSGN